MWERDGFSNLFFGKQPVKNKSYFYKSFSLTKDIFLLAIFFLCYQILENMENYLYRRFFSKTIDVRINKCERNVSMNF